MWCMGSMGHPWCTRVHVEVAYVLGGEPVPGGFLGGIVGYAKALLLYFVKEGCYQALHLEFLQVMHDWFTQFFLLCPPMGFSRGYPLPIGQWWWWCHAVSSRGSCLLQMSHPISDVPAPRHFFCTCVIHLGQGYSGLHSSFSFWRVNNSSSWNICTQNTSYTLVHTSKVSVSDRSLTSILVCILTLTSLDACS